jgi:hypothetical protein
LFVDVLGALPAGDQVAAVWRRGARDGRLLSPMPMCGAAPTATAAAPPDDGGAGVAVVASRSANTRAYRVLGNSTNARLGAAGAVALGREFAAHGDQRRCRASAGGRRGRGRRVARGAAGARRAALARVRGTTITLNVTSLWCSPALR